MVDPGQRYSGVIAALLAVGALAVVAAGTQSTLFELDRFAVPKELALATSSLLVLPFILPRRSPIQLSATETILVAFTIWSGLSAILATNPWIALRSFGLTFSGLVIFMAARKLTLTTGIANATGAPPPNQMHARCLAALGVTATFGALLGAAQAYGLDLPWLAEERAPGGTFGNRNFVAHFTAIAIPLVALLALRGRRPITRVLWLVALAICANLIVLTRSRAAWLGLAAALGVAGVAAVVARHSLFENNRSRRRLIAVVAALSMGALAAIFLPNALNWRSDTPYSETISRLTDYRGGSGRGRLIQYGNSMKLVAMDPVFGTGPGNWFVKYPLVTTPGDPSFAGVEPIPTNPWPSSDWVALLAERGPIGLLLVLLAGAAAVVTAVRVLGAGEATAAARAVAVLGMLAATLVTGLFDAVMLNAAPAFLVAAAAGLLLPDTRALLSIRASAPLRLVLVSVTLLLAATIVIRSSQQLTAIRITANDQSRATIVRAVDVDPLNHRLRLMLARRGPCSDRIGHARAAALLLPHHAAPRNALRACGVR